MAQTVKQKQTAKKTSVAKKTHKTASKARAQGVIDAKMLYQSAGAKDIITDLQAKIKLWQSYHLKVAQDGVGAKKTGYKLEDGTEEVETVTLTPNERSSHLDKSAGLQEIMDYMDRMSTPVSDATIKTAQ